MKFDTVLPEYLEGSENKNERVHINMYFASGLPTSRSLVKCTVF